MHSKKSHSLSLFLWVILISSIAILLNQPIYDTLTSIDWVEAIYKDLKSNCVYDICAMLVIIAGCFISDNAASKMDSNTAYKSLAVLTPIIVLLMCFRWNYSSIYTPFYLLPDLKYVDVSLAILLFQYIECLNHLERKETDISKLPDKENNNDTNLLFDDNDATDILGRDASAKRLAKLLVKENNKTGAFGVAVTGGWGSGKSWYLNALKKELTNKYNGTCIDFKPWVYDVKELTPTFCKLLENSLVGEGVDTDDLKALITDLLKSAGGISTISSYFLGIGKHNPSRQELIENVKSELKEAKKPIFVFMDECDRLSKEELLQVFSLIRNVCDFPYLCYILSYDKDKVGDTLKGAGGLEYTVKMIDFTVELEAISNDIILNTLADLFTSKLEQEDFKERLSRLNLTKYVPTIRELKRYWNLIYTDYNHQKEIFDKVYINLSDWIILELIKYKDNELYTILKYSPGKILTPINDAWNSPSWAFIGKWQEGKYDSLLKYLFPNEKEPANGEGIFGITNTLWTKVYFSAKLPNGFRDRHEYDFSLNKGTFESNIEKWTRQGDIAVPFVIWSAFKIKELNHPTAITCLLDYIWTKCGMTSVYFDLIRLSSGYNKGNVFHSVLGINDFIDSSNFIDYSFQQFYTPTDINEEEIQTQMSVLSTLTKRPLELISLILRLLRKIKDQNDITYKMAVSNITILWSRLTVLEENNEDIDTLNILEILYNCTLEDTFEKMSLPLIKRNPKKWLSSTLRICKDIDGKEYLLLSAERIHSLFDSLKNAESIIRNLTIILSPTNDNDKLFLEEYKHLFAVLADNTIYKDKDEIHEKYRMPSSLLKESYPILSSMPMIGKEVLMPIKNAIDQLAGSSFWKGNNLRIVRRPVDAYLNQSIKKTIGKNNRITLKNNRK